MAAAKAKKLKSEPCVSDKDLSNKTEGATPKETVSAKESKINPNSLSALIALAKAPSRTSATQASIKTRVIWCKKS